jgi:hypothetical protein
MAFEIQVRSDLGQAKNGAKLNQRPRHMVFDIQVRSDLGQAKNGTKLNQLMAPHAPFLVTGYPTAINI